MFRFDFIAVNKSAAGFEVDCMEIEPVPAGNQRECFFRILPELVGIARLAGPGAGG